MPNKISKVKTTKIYKKIVVLFGIITVLLIALIIYFSLAKTTITVTLNPKNAKTDFNIDIKKDLTSEEKNQGDILTGYLIKTTVAGEKNFANPNKGEEVPAQATGQVTIYNNWTQVQPLMATTRLLAASGILFRIKNRVDVPARGKLENVDIYADQAGAAGNIGPTKFSIPGLSKDLQEKVYAESTEPTTGGVKSAKVVTADNISQARDELIQELYQKATVEMEKDPALKTGDKILPQAITRVILEEKSSVEAGQEAASFNLNMQINAYAVIFDEDKLLSIALQKLKDELAVDQQIKNYDKKDLTYDVDTFNFDNQTTTLKVKFSAAAIPKLSSSIFNRDNIVNKDSQEIQTYFSSFDAIKNVEIKFSPFWVTRAPSLKDHIEIKIKE